MTKNDLSQYLRKNKYIIMLIIITIFYAILSFYNLGDSNSPQSYEEMNVNDYQVFKVADDKMPRKMAIYNGYKESSINIYVTEELPEDISALIPEIEYPLDYESVFKWLFTYINDEEYESPYIIIMSSGGSVRLGEIGIFDADNNLLKVQQIDDSGSKLIDEKSIVPSESSFLNSTYFDEVYFPRTVYEIVNNEYIFEFSHPPLGKYIMSIPILLFGASPFTMRLMGNIAGILMIPIMFFIGKELFKKDKYALFCSIIIALDGMHFAQTRIATVDSFLVLFCLLSFLFFMKYLNNKFTKRPYLPLALSGVFWGMAVSVKWNAFFFGIGLGIIFFYDYFKNKKIFIEEKIQKQVKKKFNYKPLLMGMIFFAIVPFSIYVISYLPIVPNENEVAPYYIRLEDGDTEYHYGKLDSIAGFFEYQYAMYYYHSHLGPKYNPDYYEHPYASKWNTWPIMLKPMAFYDYTSSNGSRSVIATMGNPLIWWLSCISFIFTFIYVAFKKDSRVGAILLIIIIATMAPNIGIDRDTYIYHYFIALQFMILTIVFMTMKLVEWKPKLKYLMPILSIIFFISFAYFYPVYSGLPISSEYIESTKWLNSWTY